MAERYDRQLAIEKAASLCELLSPSFIRLEVAGSLRRGYDRVKDIELIGVGAFGVTAVGLFDEPNEVNLVTQQVEDLLKEGTLTKRPDPKTGSFHFGKKSMRLVFEGVAVDLFVTYDAMNFGLLKMIRTGPFLFSKRLVTPSYQKGLLLNQYQVQDGWIRLKKGSERIPTPEESDVFDCLTINWVEPKDRAQYGFPATPKYVNKRWGSKS